MDGGGGSPGASTAWRRRRPLGKPPSTALPPSARRRSPARLRAALRARSARAVPTGAHVDGVALSEASCELGGSRAPRKPQDSLAGGRRPQISPSSPPIESTAPKQRVWRGQASVMGQRLPQSLGSHKNRRPKRSDPKSARSRHAATPRSCYERHGTAQPPSTGLGRSQSRESYVRTVGRRA